MSLLLLLRVLKVLQLLAAAVAVIWHIFRSGGNWPLLPPRFGTRMWHHHRRRRHAVPSSVNCVQGAIIWRHSRAVFARCRCPEEEGVVCVCCVHMARTTFGQSWVLGCEIATTERRRRRCPLFLPANEEKGLDLLQLRTRTEHEDDEDNVRKLILRSCCKQFVVARASALSFYYYSPFPRNLTHRVHFRLGFQRSCGCRQKILALHIFRFLPGPPRVRQSRKSFQKCQNFLLPALIRFSPSGDRRKSGGRRLHLPKMGLHFQTTFFASFGGSGVIQSAQSWPTNIYLNLVAPKSQIFIVVEAATTLAVFHFLFFRSQEFLCSLAAGAFVCTRNGSWRNF